MASKLFSNATVYLASKRPSQRLGSQGKHLLLIGAISSALQPTLDAFFFNIFTGDAELETIPSVGKHQRLCALGSVRSFSLTIYHQDPFVRRWQERDARFAEREATGFINGGPPSQPRWPS